MNAKLLGMLHSQKFYSFSGSVFTAGFSLLNFSLLARSLTKVDMGLWTFFLTVYSLSELVRNGLVGRPLIKMGAEGGREYQRSLIGSAFRICFWASLAISVVIAIVFILIWLISKEQFYINVIFWFVICTILSIPSSFAIWTNSIQIKFQRVTIVSGCMKFFFMIGSILVYYYELGLEWVFIFFSISIVITSLMSLTFGWSNLKGTLRYSKRYIGKIFKFGKFSLGTMLGGSALTSSDNLLIMTFLGPEALAVYSVPMRIIGLYDIPLRALVQIAFPTLAKVKNEHGDESFANEFEKSNGFTFLVLLPVSILIFVFAEPIIVLIGGSEYTEAAILLRIFSLYLLITPLDRFAGIALDVMNYPNRNFKKMMLMLVVNVVGDLCAIYFGGGITYVAVASIGTFALGTGIGFYYLRDRVPFKLTSLLRAGKDEIVRVSRKLLFK